MVTRGQALYRLRTGAKGSGTLLVVHRGKGVRHFVGGTRGQRGQALCRLRTGQRGQALCRLRTGLHGGRHSVGCVQGKGVRHFADCAQDCMGSGTLPVTYRGTWGQTPRFIGDLL